MSKQSKAMSRFIGKKREVIKDKYLCPNCGNKKFIMKSSGRATCSKCRYAIKI